MIDPHELDTLAARFEAETSAPPDGIAPTWAFEYMRYKAFVYLQLGPEKYRTWDAYALPDASWSQADLEAIDSGCRQILDWRGVSRDRCLQGLEVAGCDALLTMFHFRRRAFGHLSTGPEDIERLAVQSEHVTEKAESILFLQVPLVVHWASGVKLPALSAAFFRADVTEYHSDGLDIGVAYGGFGILSGVQATAFVVRRRWPDMDAELADVERSVDGAYEHVQRARRAPIAVANLAGLEGVFEFQNTHCPEPARVVSSAWLFPRDGWLLKVRCTNWVGAPEDQVAAAFRNLVEAIALRTG